MTVSPRRLLLQSVSVISWVQLGNLQMIRNIAKRKGHGDLEEEADRGHGVAGKLAKAKAPNNGWGVRVKGALRSVVGHGDE